MKVLLLSQYFPPEVGATQTRMHHFARRLSEAGHSVTVIAEMPNHPAGVFFPGYKGRRKERSLEDGFEVIRIWVCASPIKSAARRLLFYASYMLNAIFAAVLMSRGRPDVVFVTSPPLPAAFAGYVVSRLKRCPFVLDVRDVWPAVGIVLGEIRGRPLIMLAEKLERFLYRKAAAITCVTHGFAEDISQKKDDSTKVHVLPNGTIPELFHPDASSPALKRHLGLQEKFVVGFFGNHGVAQDLPAIFETARLLKGRPEFHFLFVGEGPVKAELLAAKAKSGLDNVDLMPQVAVTQVARYIGVADVVLVPLKQDGIFSMFVPSKMFDFMACAKPIILTVDGEARSILEASGGGIYVKPGDPEVLAKCLADLCARPERLTDMGERGRAFVLEHYLRDQQADRLRTILAGVTDSLDAQDEQRFAVCSS